MEKKLKIKSIHELYDILPESEMLMVDLLRELIKEKLPSSFKEKISYNVPYFFGNRGICIIWPSTIPRGGIKSGVLLGFWQGNKLKDPDQYLTHGTNNKIFYKIYQSVEEIDPEPILNLLVDAIEVDRMQR